MGPWRSRLVERRLERLADEPGPAAHHHPRLDRHLEQGPQPYLWTKTADETGLLKPSDGAAAQLVAELAVGAHVVKALHLFAGQSWLEPDQSASQPIRTVAMCGDDISALDVASTLVRDLGGQPAVLGGLDRARQLEDVAGFVIRLVSCGFNPAAAVPSVPGRSA